MLNSENTSFLLDRFKRKRATPWYTDTEWKDRFAQINTEEQNLKMLVHYYYYYFKSFCAKTLYISLYIYIYLRILNKVPGMKKYSSTFQWRMAVFHLYGYSTYKDTRSCPSYVDHDIQSERHWPSAGHVTRVRVTKSSARPPENPPPKNPAPRLTLRTDVMTFRHDVYKVQETHIICEWGEKQKKTKKNANLLHSLPRHKQIP